MRRTLSSPGRLALALWSGTCVAVPVLSLWAAWPHSPGAAVAFYMFVLTAPVSPATGALLNAVEFGRWLPAGEPWHSLTIWLAFFVPGLLQWLAVRGLWRRWRGPGSAHGFPRRP